MKLSTGRNCQLPQGYEGPLPSNHPPIPGSLKGATSGAAAGSSQQYVTFANAVIWTADFEVGKRGCAARGHGEGGGLRMCSRGGCVGLLVCIGANWQESRRSHKSNSMDLQEPHQIEKTLAEMHSPCKLRRSRREHCRLGLGHMTFLCLHAVMCPS